MAFWPANKSEMTKREKSPYRRLVVKIGSNVLTRQDGTLDITRICSLVDQLAMLHAEGIECIVISSGAVAAGRSELPGGRKLDSVSARQLFSAVGQAKLINRYYDFFRERGIVCGQVLTTKESLSTRDHYLNQKNCMETMLRSGVIPILNENDTISVSELMFTDNDELAGLVSTMMGADALIILSNIDGIYDGNPGSGEAQLIREVYPETSDLARFIRTERSSFGRGGMLTKSRIARKVAAEGIEVVIACGRRDGILVDLAAGKEVPCTRFIPSEHPVSGVKKWIAHSEGFAKGIIHINQGALEALTGPTATSLLPIGVVRVEGDFDRGDIVRIVGPEGEPIGVGQVSTDSIHAAQTAGRKGLRPLIHYDYLFLD